MTRAKSVLSTARGRRFGLLLAAATLVRLLVLWYPGFSGDVAVYASWGIADTRHFFTVYSHAPTANYAPLSIYIYGAGTAVYLGLTHLLGVTPNLNIYHSPLFSSLLKAQSLVADLGITTVIYAVARRQVSDRWALLAAGAYAFFPVFLLIDNVWGQTDGLSALFCLLMFVFAVRRQGVLAGIAAGLALMLKPQPIIFLPLIALYFARWVNSRETKRFIGTLLATCVLIWLPFGPHIVDQFAAYVRNTTHTISAYATQGAQNLWWVIARPGYDVWTQPPGPTAWSTSLRANQALVGGISATDIGVVLFLLAFALVALKVWHDGSPGAFLAGGAVVALAFFEVVTTQHERYFYPAAVLLLAAALYQRRYALWFAVVSLLGLINVVGLVILSSPPGTPGLTLYWEYNLLFWSNRWWLMYLIAVISVLAFLALLVSYLRAGTAAHGTVASSERAATPPLPARSLLAGPFA